MLLHKRLKLASSFRRLPRERYGRRNAVDLTVAPIDRAVSGIAEPSCRFGERIEHWSKIESRAADDLQHVAGRGLVFERFFEVARTLAQFAEQPRVLYRDRRLCGEVFQQCDLLVRERPHLLAEGRDRAEQAVVLAQRDIDHGTRAAALDQSSASRADQGFGRNIL